MATELIKVVKDGWEEIHNILTDKLQNLETDIETKVSEYRAQLTAASEDDKQRLENMINDCLEVKEIEVSEVEEDSDAVTEENYIGE